METPTDDPETLEEKIVVEEYRLTPASPPGYFDHSGDIQKQSQRSSCSWTYQNTRSKCLHRVVDSPS